MKKFFSFVKIEHTLFTLPLIYAGFILGMHSTPTAGLLILVLLSATGARTAAFALNRIIDRNIDSRNPRTVIREIPSGKMTVAEGYAVLVVGLLTYFVTGYLISPFCFMISPIPLLIFFVYPYMKRFTAMAHFGVGLGMSMAPLGGYFAASPSFGNILPAILLCLFTIFWGTGFDIIYATLDEEFDRKEMLYSFVSRFGRDRALAWSAAFHGVAFTCLTALFFITVHTLYALPFLVITGLMLLFEQKRAHNVELAFFRVNSALGFVVFAMIVTGVMIH